MKKTKAISTEHARGEILHQFQSVEFLQFHRDASWYLIAGLVAISVIAVGVLTKSIFLVIAFFLFVGVYWLTHHHAPRLLPVTIYDRGIDFDGEFISNETIKSFWLLDKPPTLQAIKLQTDRKLNHVVTIYSFGENADFLREILSKNLTETPRDEDFVDALARVLKL